ncbi:MAG: hypothetical protein R3Y12_04470 [Clostridia bacterium]
MKTVIYINQDRIQLVTETGKNAQRCTEIELEVGTILNGVIVKEAEILNKLASIDKSAWKKPVTLVIDSSNLTIKKIETPPIPQKHLNSVVRGEIDVLNEDNYLFDYSLIFSSKKDGNLLVGSAVQKEFIEKYIDLFKKAKIKLASIDVAVNGIVKYVCKSPTLSRESFILNIISSNNMMLSLMFENGQFSTISRNRLIQESDTEAYITELFSKLTSMLQYNSSKSSEYQIRTSYYVGLSQETLTDLALYAEELDVFITPFMERQITNECFYACCGVYSMKDDINFNKKFISSVKGPGKSPDDKIQGAIVLGLAVIVGAYWMNLYQGNVALQNEIDPLEAYVISPAVIETQAELEIVKAKTTSVENQIAEYINVLDQISNSRIINQSILSLIYSQMQIDGIEYKTNDLSIMMSVTGFSNTDPSDYAEMLRNCGYFSYLVYDGYEVGSSDNDDNTYTFNVGVILDIPRDPDVEEEVQND